MKASIITKQKHFTCFPLLTLKIPNQEMESLQSDSGTISMLEGSKVQPQKAPLPAWLQPLLTTRFFEQCKRHNKEKKKIINHFCVECKSSMCPNCVVEHSKKGSGKHKLLQIRHYVHSDVVRVNEVFKILNISKIQQYIANGMKVVHLNPKSSKPCPDGVPNSYIDGTPCVVCFRAISKPSFYCCIACKITECPAKKEILRIKDAGECSTSNQSGAGANRCLTEKDEPSTSAPAAPEPEPEKNINYPPVWVSFRKKSRKGIPVRAAFF